jgi:hypothetical protein
MSAGAVGRAGAEISRSGGSRGLGRTYFFLAVVFFAVLFLAVLVFAAVFFAPVDFEAAFAMLPLPSVRFNRRIEITVPNHGLSKHDSIFRSPLVLKEQIEYE